MEIIKAQLGGFPNDLGSFLNDWGDCLNGSEDFLNDWGDLPDISNILCKWFFAFKFLTIGKYNS